MFGFPTGQSVVFLAHQSLQRVAGNGVEASMWRNKENSFLAEAVRREMLDLHSSPIANNSLHVHAIHNPRDFRNFEHS
jgi:hypothetical protein